VEILFRLIGGHDPAINRQMQNNAIGRIIRLSGSVVYHIWRIGVDGSANYDLSL
jgi:hypothetical protein